MTGDEKDKKEEEEEEEEEGDGDPKISGLAFVRGGKVEAEFVREDRRMPQEQNSPQAMGRRVGSEQESNSPVPSAQDLRNQRLAGLGASLPSSREKEAAPARQQQQQQQPPSSPPPSAAPRKVATPGSAQQLMKATLERESNCGYLLRYVFQVRRGDEDFEDRNIPSLLSAIFLGVQDDFRCIRNQELWDRADKKTQVLTEELVEEFISAHPLRDDGAFIITAYGRIRTCLQDTFIRDQFTPSCVALKAAIRIHYLSSFIPAVLDPSSPERTKTLRTLVMEADVQSASDLMEDISEHLTDDEGVAEEVLGSLLRYLLHEDEVGVQQGGLATLIRLCGYVGRLCRSPAGAKVLSDIITKETAANSTRSGIMIVMQSWLRRFFNSPPPEEVKAVLDSVRDYPKVPPQETEAVLARPRDILTSITRNIATLLKDALLKKGAAGRQTVLGWLVGQLRQLEPRSQVSKNTLQRLRQQQASDVFSLNLATVSLVLSDPVCQKLGEKADLSFAGSARATSLFPFWRSLTRLDRDYAVPEGPGEEFNFATEILFVSAQAMRCLVMPAVKVARWAHEEYMRALAHAHGNPEAAQMMHDRLVAMAVMWDSLRLQLLSPSFVDLATKLSVTTCCILDRELKRAPTSDIPAAVSGMPVFILEDALDWAVFVCQYAPHLVKGAEGMPQLLGFAINASTHPSLLRRHGMIQTRIVALIAAMQDNQHNAARTYDDVWAASQWGGPRSTTSLFNIVEKSPACSHLPQLLFKVYSSPTTEGFDIDKDDHLAHARDHVLPLFVQLVVVDAFKAGLLEGLNKGVSSDEGEEDDFAMFVHKLVTEATHCLDDALNRLTEVNDIAKIMANKAEWNNLPQHTRQTKEHHFQATGRSAKGFMGSAMKSLQVVQMLLNPTRAEQPPPLPKALSSPTVLRSLAHLVRYFWAQMHGARGDNLKSLPTPQKYDYDRLKILQTLGNIVALLATSEEFHKVFALHDDYERWVVAATVTEVHRTQLGGLPLLERLQKFADSLQALNPQSSTAPAAAMSDAAWNPPQGKLPVSNQEKYTELMADIHFEQVSLGGEDSCLAGYQFKEEAAKAHRGPQAMKDLLKAFKREWKLFADLPLYPQASIFVRVDENDMSVMKMAVTGPEDSPYSYGMFFFDLFLPSNYPAQPPLVWLKTTGGGTVRFNPNLYESGKVCLSLLGTWYGDGDETKWQPGVSSVYQVGTSIQSMILVPDPYFNEPGNEREKGTPEGEKWSADYNEGLRLGTLRYAILENIKAPPKGCEEMVATYYKQMAPVVLATAHRWAAEASESRRPKFLRVLEQLVECLGDGADTETWVWTAGGRAQLTGRKRQVDDMGEVQRQTGLSSESSQTLGQSLLAALQQQQQSVAADDDEENLTEDEQLARAIARSMADM